MCVWFPLWPIQRLQSSQQEHNHTPNFSASPPAQKRSPRPLVLFSEGKRGLQIVVCSPEAEKWGIQTGMPLGEARSLLPRTTAKNARPPRGRPAKVRGTNPQFLPADPVADRQRLQILAQECLAYSPLVGLEDSPAPEAIWLEVSGSEALFGGERPLADTLSAGLARQGLRVRIAIADSWGAAWAMSHYGASDIALVPIDRQREWLAPLSIAALRIPETVIRSLIKLDVLTIEQLLRLSRTALPARFGKELLCRLDQALGQAPELLTAERITETIFDEWQFEEPITDRQTIDHVCELLLQRLLTQLDARRAGLRELACHWLGTTAEPTTLRLLRPTNDRRHLLELLRLQCERRTFTAAIQGIRMEVVEMGLALARQTTLFGDASTEENPRVLAELVDRLSIRLGRQAVLRPRLVPDPQPEFAYEPVPWLDRHKPRDEATFSSSALRCRPLRLFHPPRPLSIQIESPQGLPMRVHHSQVQRMIGPERIETGWWRAPDVKRDYYRMDLANGTRLWTFVERGTGHWFLHGLFV